LEHREKQRWLELRSVAMAASATGALMVEITPTNVRMR
jgi:hypothetical protein